jgi:Domain of unknown function (DUF3291)
MVLLRSLLVVKPINRCFVHAAFQPDGSSTPSLSWPSSSQRCLLAHMNFARLRAPYEDPTMSEFNLAMGPVNAIAKSTPGFVWSLNEYAPGERQKVPLLRDDPLVMPQLSLWEDVESIQHFAFKSGHAMYMKRKREWFTYPTDPPYAVCWWFWPSAGNEHPTLEQAFDRCQHLREHGPSDQAFDFKTAKQFPKPLP